ncbi:MAG: type II toxin-antitoxin system VapC family toxin [Proteobacteria bacterium]|nr:type II toxin-antitoxin system VapC family toxin [Pseudomonadota bacterium]
MSLYLDASVLVALLTHDPLTARAEAFFRAHTPSLVVSDFAAAEFASALARRVRTEDLTEAEARSAFTTLDTWAARATQRAETTPADVAAAGAYLRRLDLTLRTPDALNIAIAQRVGADVATFDTKMAVAARALGLAAPALMPA